MPACHASLPSATFEALASRPLRGPRARRVGASGISAWWSSPICGATTQPCARPLRMRGLSVRGSGAFRGSRGSSLGAVSPLSAAFSAWSLRKAASIVVAVACRRLPAALKLRGDRAPAVRRSPLQSTSQPSWLVEDPVGPSEQRCACLCVHLRPQNVLKSDHCETRTNARSREPLRFSAYESPGRPSRILTAPLDRCAPSRQHPLPLRAQLSRLLRATYGLTTEGDTRWALPK